MRLVETRKTVLGLPPQTPSASVPARINMRNVRHLTAVITGLNTTAVTGSAITLQQSKDVSGTGEKAVSFSTVWADPDTAASDFLTETAVVSNTFTTTATNSKSYVYVLEVPAETLDTNNGFTFLRVGTGNGTATTLSVTYFCDVREKGGATEPTVIA